MHTFPNFFDLLGPKLQYPKSHPTLGRYPAQITREQYFLIINFNATVVINR